MVAAFDHRFDAGWPRKDAADALAASLVLDSPDEGLKLMAAVAALVKVSLGVPLRGAPVNRFREERMFLSFFVGGRVLILF